MEQLDRMSRDKSEKTFANALGKQKPGLVLATLLICLMASIISAGTLLYLLSGLKSIDKTHLSDHLYFALPLIPLISAALVTFMGAKIYVAANKIVLKLRSVSESDDYEARFDPDEFVVLRSLVGEINSLLESADCKAKKVAEMSGVIEQREQENQLLWLEIEHNLCLAKEEAETDGLTKLYNRKSVENRFREEFERVNANKKPFSVLMCDLDHFKNINDTFGHEVGDEVLRLFADVLREETRSDDTPARYGGEEFVVLLPGTPGDGALLVAERINKAFEKTSNEKFSHEHAGMICTVSIGIADYPTCTIEKDRLISMADVALYQAKEDGRNRVVYYRDVEGGQEKEIV